ncbi:MAG: hypothetical protein ACRDO1_17915 [Nocardioidaceae bacterium]
MRGTRVALAAGVVALPLAFGGPVHAHTGHTETVNFTLNELNSSGASADATVTANEDGSLHVQISGSGFTPNSPHAQHIHGAAHSQNFFCPPASADKNGDGQVATEEGLPQYGDVFISLTTKGDTTKKSGLAVDRMPMADADGNLDYDRTIPADAVPDGTIESLSHLHIVQHGLDANGNDKYDMEALGESVFAKSLGVKGIPEEATNPATCGEVTPAGGVETGAAGTEGVEQLPMMAFGGLAMATAAGTLLLRRRYARAS